MSVSGVRAWANGEEAVTAVDGERTMRARCAWSGREGAGGVGIETGVHSSWLAIHRLGRRTHTRLGDQAAPLNGARHSAARASFPARSEKPRKSSRQKVMTDFPLNHDLGRIDVIDMDDTPALSRDVTLDITTIQAAWPDFEGSFDSLQGRRMMGLFYDETGVYRLCATRLGRDHNNPLGLDETVIPGGRYLRLRLRGRAPSIYEDIAPAFDALFERADHDPGRPHIEYYRREGEIDCLVPVRSSS